MKRLLLISYHFPPEPAAGAIRPGYLARYLPQHGWEVVVVTRPFGDPGFATEVLATGVPSLGIESRIRESFESAGMATDNGLRTALRTLKEKILFPDRTAPWIPRALKRALKATSERRFDAVMSTAMPASVHVVGGLLARKTNLPWIADYRDPWAGNRYASRGFIRASLEHALERWLISRADCVTAISEPIAEVLKRFHSRNDVRVLPNAYDPSEWASLQNLTPPKFSMCYTGSMYDGQRRPDILFEAIAQLRAEGDPAASVAVEFYGPNSDFVDRVAANNGIGDIVTRHGTISRSEAMRRQRVASTLLIVLSMDPHTGLEMGSKFLEYVGAGRPIVAIGPPHSVMKPFLERYELGWFASNVEEAKLAVRAAHERFTRGEYDIAVSPDAVPTADELAERFAAVLDEMVMKRARIADPLAPPYLLRQ